MTFYKPALLTVTQLTAELPHIICEAHLDGMFSRAIMATIRTQPGTYLDFLFDANGYPMALNTTLARLISQHFNKSFSNFQYTAKILTHENAG